MNIQKIEFKDEILDTSGQPDNKPRYRMRDNNGTVLYDNVILEVATPITQEGTEITADMFDKVNATMLSVASRANGEDFKKYIETGEYGGIKTPDILDPLYELKDLWQKEIESKINSLNNSINSLSNSISSLNTRVTALENASSK